MGFMSTVGSMPAASAWTAWARPISSPSRVTAALSAMFWALKGATRNPSWRKIRHRAATSRLLPTDDAVPCTISVLAGMRSLQDAGDGLDQSLALWPRSNADSDVLGQAEG